MKTNIQGEWSSLLMGQKYILIQLKRFPAAFCVIDPDFGDVRLFMSPINKESWNEN